MKSKIHAPAISLAALVLLAGASTVTAAQTPTSTPQTQTQAAPAAPATQAQNLQQELNLTPDQIQKWRELNRELRPQEQAGKQRVEQAKRALAEAMESPNPNEELIKQRAKELADAQSTMTQLNALRQARVLQILTPEQRVRLKEIRAQQQQAIRERNQAMRGNGTQQPPRNGAQRQGVPRNANTTTVTPKQQRKILKQTTRR